MSKNPIRCSCSVWGRPEVRTLDRQCPVHGDDAERARRAEAGRRSCAVCAGSHRTAQCRHGWALTMFEAPASAQLELVFS